MLRAEGRCEDHVRDAGQEDLYLFISSVKGEGDPEPLVEALRKLDLDTNVPIEEERGL